MEPIQNVLFTLVFLILVIDISFLITNSSLCAGTSIVMKGSISAGMEIQSICRCLKRNE